MIVVQSNIDDIESFQDYSEDAIIDAVKRGNRKSIIVARNDEGFFKYEGKRGNCEKSRVQGIG